MERWRKEAGRPLCACECGKRVKTPGSKYYHGHARRNLEQRFWAKVRKTNDCWFWTAATFRESGYGQFWIDGKKRRANRVAWEIAHGPIPSGMVVRHTCDEPACVNPEHLKIGSQADNNRDMMERQRMSSKLTAEDALAIRIRYARGSETYESLAKRYDVSSAAIGKIIRLESWT